MAHIVMTDARVEVNGVNLSDHVKSATLDLDKEVQDNTAMGDTFRKTLDSFKTWKCAVEFYVDFAAGEIDDTLFPLYNNNTVFTLKVRPTSAAISATNPEYSASARLKNYQPIAGSIGSVAMTTVNFEPSTAMTRATA